MKSIVDIKYKELIGKLESLPFRANAILGLFGMARTINITNILAKDNNFKDLGILDKAINEILNILVWNKMEDVKKYCDICENLIEFAEVQTKHEYLNQKEENVFGLAYMILETWFYFLQTDFRNLKGTEDNDFRRFILFPAEIIQEYLSTENSSIKLKIERQNIINSNKKLLNELLLVDKDTNFILCKNYEVENICRKVKEYSKVDILA